MTDAELRKIERSAHPDSMLGRELAPLIVEIRRSWAAIVELEDAKLFWRERADAFEIELATLHRRPESNALVTILYTNHRGEARERRIIPQRLWFGATQWHPEPQWLLDAFDLDRQAFRSFAVQGVNSWVESKSAPGDPLTAAT